MSDHPWSGDEVRPPRNELEAASVAGGSSVATGAGPVATPSLADSAAQPKPVVTLADALEVAGRLRARVQEHVMGRDEIIDVVLVAMLADGHMLLEDYPGSGKTTLAKALGESIVDVRPEEEIAAFRRVQFTPDLLPSDITGVMIFDTDSNTFQFRRGPVFAHVLLVDEINRTSPKVQAALLEAMAEKQVTVDNVSHQLDELFFVIATQNPRDVAGTYPLPLAQIDRFIFKVRMDHIDRESELQVLETWGSPKPPCKLPKVSRHEVIEARRVIRREVQIGRGFKECLVDTAANLRADKRVVQGVSTRALVQAVPALQTLALFRGRDYVATEDVEYLMPLLLWHRIELIPGAEDAAEIILEAAQEPVEKLSRSTLKRRLLG